jgi:Malectin domain
MQTFIRFRIRVGLASFVVCCALAVGCQTERNDAPAGEKVAAATTSPPAPVPLASPTVVAPGDSIFRVKAGDFSPFTDASGNVWLPDQGFDGGDTIDRDPDLAIANTKDPGLYRSEHYAMDSFSCQIPDGNYTAKLYFAETFDDITDVGQRVFSFNVQGREFKDFDVWAKAGGPDRAYVVTVPVAVTNGVFRIDFTSEVENPEINAIEIIPQR